MDPDVLKSFLSGPGQKSSVTLFTELLFLVYSVVHKLANSAYRGIKELNLSFN
jgi:hypothetical protein